MISPAFRVVSTSAKSLQLALVLHGPRDLNVAPSGAVPAGNTGPAVHAPIDADRALSVASYRADRDALAQIYSLAVASPECPALARVWVMARSAFNELTRLKVECGYLPCMH